MNSFSTNIEEKTQQNDFFREVLFTAPHSQLVVMSLLPMEDIGVEIHSDGDQFIRIESGEGKAIVDGQEYILADGSVVIIPAGAQHNIINTSADNKLKLYTIYSPAHHAEGTIHKTKAEALASEASH